MAANRRRRERRLALFNAGHIKATERERAHAEATLEDRRYNYLRRERRAKARAAARRNGKVRV